MRPGKAADDEGERELGMKSWIALLLAVMLLAAMPALAEQDEEIVFSDFEEAPVPEAGEFLLGEDDNLVGGYAPFLTEGAENEGDVPIDEAHFPDRAFRNYLSSFDTDLDGVLSGAQCGDITKLTPVSRSIVSLAGLKYFPNLQWLECPENTLADLDVGGNPALTYLNCFDNRLTELDVSRNAALTVLGCSQNQLTRLDVRANTALESLWCEENQIGSLDLSRNALLKDLDCCRNLLTGLDVRQNTALTTLRCGDNEIASLDVSRNAALEKLWCGGNRLSNLDVTRNTALTELYCNDNQLSGLDLSRNGNLVTILCYHNSLSTLDLTGCGEALRQALLNAPVFAEWDSVPGVLCLEKSGVYGMYFDETTTLTIDGRTVYSPQKVELSACKITIKDKTYTGKALKPNPVVKYDGETLVKGTDYTVSYKNNTKVGKATATIKGMGRYTGSRKISFKIKPRSVAFSKVTGGARKITLKWKKQTKQVSGYQIQYGTKKDFSGAKALTVKGAQSSKKTIKNLKAKKNYYVRIRTYKTVNGKKYYSAWSKSKKVKTKELPVPTLSLRDLEASRYRYFRKYMSESEFQAAFDVAVEIVKPLYWCSREDQLYGIATALRDLFESGGFTYTMQGKHYRDPYGYFIQKQASCAGCTRATGLCLNILGISYEHVNENQYSHQWARVKVGDTYWICDAFGLYCGPEPGVRQHPYL